MFIFQSIQLCIVFIYLVSYNYSDIMAKVKCASCGGSGECRRCNGTGEIVDILQNLTCARCGGTGVCPACNGSGYVEADD